MAKPKKTSAPTLLSPPPPPKPLDPYAMGMLDALRIMKGARDDLEAPVKKVRDDIGAAYVALNGVTHWGQAVVSEAESRIMKALIARTDVDAKEGA